MTGRVLANATADFLSVIGPSWAVYVWGQPPHDENRSYTIEAESDTLAAQEGIRRFCDEMSARPEH